MPLSNSPRGEGRKIVKQIRRERRTYDRIMSYTIVLGVLWLIMLWKIPNSRWYLVLAAPIVFLPAEIYPFRLRRSLRKLAETEGERALGSLAELLLGSEDVVKRAAADAIIRLSEKPELKFTGHLTQYQLACLIEGMETGGRQLAFAIMKLFTHVGDCEVFEHVERLAQGKGRARWDRQIHEAAHRCMERLEEP